MTYFLSALKNYAVFSGRTRRRDYWMFVLFNIIFSIVASILDRLLGTNLTTPEGYVYGGVISCIYSLAILIPSLAIVVRRLHDINKSGGWIFIFFIPIIGWIWLLILLCTAGTAGENRFGGDPIAEEVL